MPAVIDVLLQHYCDESFPQCATRSPLHCTWPIAHAGLL